ncbi:pyruvate dehydrogenase phosphatase regulatory subunit, mitochondrial-like [Pecten maximus]|uniref:pyruvate dehydrogenase phosphatase regulatory subunit, mitochondrial-like n=1 Tax=Pecten maximus TaxID=6579 RepID=UPI001458AB7E|nr:pyruvate dehydrogenase phosphatase regulatory subunit, mitochondrial-like [Pecten maximus]XP_033755630.1 pyruvate dehydrogenase phosphatase regulatory subunit, mitochondrial-like [Pecten maximus]
MALVSGILRGLGRGLRSPVQRGLWTTTSRQYSEGTVTGNENNGPSVKVPSSARVVILGGGVLGTSIAYHLAERGWTDVVLLEQGRLTCGTTWHSAGMVGQAKDEVEGSQLVAYSRQLYKQLDKSHGVGWKECGSVFVAQTKDRLTFLQRKNDIALATGIESHMISPEEAGKLCPWVRTDDLKGALWVPGDGALTPPDLVSAYTSIARGKGVKILEGVKIDQIHTKNGRVSHVTTSHGDINCEYFVNCAGLWAREVGTLSEPNVKIPLHPNEHFYLVTAPIKGLDPLMPVVRDFDGGIYAREWSGGLLAGGFEPRGKPVFHNGIPDKFEFQLLPEDWDHFQVLLDPILHRFPCMETAEVRHLVNGPESFTPDGHWNLGESPEVKNYFVAAGMNSMGVVGSGGIGKHLTEWIIDGEPSINLAEHDILRYVPHHSNKKFLKERVKETIALYAMRFPYEYWETGRKLRTSPLHTRLEVDGACFGETNAYERPIYFARPEDEPADQYHPGKGSYGKPPWFENVKEEYLACKERVCLIDMSSFSKFEVKSNGPEALNFLEYLSSNDIEDNVGEIIHTGMQNNHGGYENDCTIVPLNHNHFFIISPASQQTRSLAWLQRFQPDDGSVQIRDITSAYAGINVIGPHAQQLLADVTDISTTLKDFKPMTCKVINVGFASDIRAMRLTHGGEDGFILYVPSEYALHVYDTLMSAGKDYGIRHAGYYALKMLRIEKFYAYWGNDLTTHTTPLECGRDFRVKLDAGDFIGKEALLKQKEEGISQRFVQFLLEDFNVDTDVWPWGGEPIYRNGKFSGTTTSSGYGFKLDKMVCLGFIRDYDEQGKSVLYKNMNQFVLDRNAKYEIAIGGRMFEAKVRLYTPKEAYSTPEPAFIPVPSMNK